ncbi:MAG: tetratricopeptide repeat protein [Desulfobacter sp.]|nr:MAG: tetratricopeptide repeat protein [Desulfobacter sp.]
MTTESSARCVKRWGPVVLLLAVSLLAPGCMGAWQKKADKGVHTPEAVRKSPEVWDTSQLEPDHTALARDLVGKGFYDVALVQLKTAVEKGASGVETFNLAGVCTRETGESAQSLAYFKRALALEPDNASVNNNIAILYTLMDKTKDARRHFSRAVALDPARGDYFNNFGYFLMAHGDNTGAEALFRQALALAPSNETAVNNLAICLGRQDKDSQALTLLMDHQPAEQAFYNMGCIYREGNDPVRARAMFELSRKNAPDQKIKSQKVFDRQVMNPNAPADSAPAEGMAGDVAHTIYTKKYLPGMKADNALKSKD